MTLDKALVELFANFRWYYVIDIIFMIALLYFALLFFKRTGFQKFSFILLALCAAFAAGRALEGVFPALSLMLTIVGVSTLAVLAAVFAPELRRGIISLNTKRIGRLIADTEGIADEDMSLCVNEIVRALLTLAKNNVGALLVFCTDEIPSVVESGTRLDAEVSGPLIASIFNTKSPLHDGAAIVMKNRIIAAGCFLPLSQDVGIPRELGTRHRAGIGISEEENVLTVIVSEETGVISIARSGEFIRYCDGAMLTKTLETFYGLRSENTRKRRYLV